MYNLAVAQLGTTDLMELPSNPSLAEDTSELVQFGAQIFDPKTGNQIVLVKDE